MLILAAGRRVRGVTVMGKADEVYAQGTIGSSDMTLAVFLIFFHAFGKRYISCGYGVLVLRLMFLRCLFLGRFYVV